MVVNLLDFQKMDSKRFLPKSPRSFWWKSSKYTKNKRPVDFEAWSSCLWVWYEYGWWCLETLNGSALKFKKKVVVRLLVLSENGFKKIFARKSKKILVKILEKHLIISGLLTLNPDLASCRCGMSMVDGALKHPWIMLSNSKIKSGG